MLSSIMSIALIVFFSLVPLLLWSYGNIYLSHHIWNRARFFAGIFGWLISIVCILAFRSWLMSSGLEQIGAVIWVFIVLWGITSIAILYGSPYIRGFLWRILMLHIALFSLLLYVWWWIQDILPMTISSLGFIGGISWFFIAACLEEWVKHVSSIGLTARDFRFSRGDFLVFTFFVTLGFVSVENILYLIEAYRWGTLSVFTTGIYRLLFALPLHVFAASICVVFWWRALSYGWLSWRYISLFLLGFIIAIVMHSFYNLLIERGDIIPLIALLALWYIACTQWLVGSEISEKKAEIL